MNNETFGITFQYAICKVYDLKNSISLNRVDKDLLYDFIKSKIIKKIFKKVKPVEYISDSKKYTSRFIKKCPHNFLLSNNETFSVRTFQGNGKMFAPKVVGQAGVETFNHFFGHLNDEEINRNNFKDFSLNHIDEMLPIIIDYALVSDLNCWFYIKDSEYKYEVLKRGNLPELTFDFSKFSFSKTNSLDWNESNTIKYNDKTVLEIQLHTNRKGFKIRLHRENFPLLLKKEKEINNSLLGDSAELAICNIFNLDLGKRNTRLVNNSNIKITKAFENHYNLNRNQLFPLKPILYSGTERRERGGQSKSGVDFLLENNMKLSLKTNKSKSFKVCPPEIGQPTPKTFDHYFANRGWYEGAINEEKFRDLVKDKSKVVLLLSEYVKFLNECDYLLWSLYLNDDNIISKLVAKSELADLTFNPNLIEYSNDFTKTSSVTIKYGIQNFSLGEFQVHSARNSLKFRFNINNLLSV